MRVILLLWITAGVTLASAGTEPAREFVHAVEFPYYLYPRSLWERELVWLKTIGIRTVAFSIPWNWHETAPAVVDLTGSTSARRDLLGLIRVLRRLGLQAWIRPTPPVRGWIDQGYPKWAMHEPTAARRWLELLRETVAPYLEKHGGPIAYVEGGGGVFDVPAPPAPVMSISAIDGAALPRSREILGRGRGAVLWEDVEDALYPVGWETPAGSLLRKGAVSLSGEEQPSTAALRRNAALLRDWAPLVGSLRPVRRSFHRLAAGVQAAQFAAPNGISAVNVVNHSRNLFQDELRVYYPANRHSIVIPRLKVPAGEAIWVPIQVPLAGPLCANCSVFPKQDHIVYATAELLSMEFENGILAMEFAAPLPGEVVVQLSRRPSGPLLAAGHLTNFDWDEKSLRARLPIPEGKGIGWHVRIGLAIAPPDSSAFFVDPPRLIIGRTNRLATSYSSADLAERSRLRAPANFAAQRAPKSPTEIDYEVSVPSEALHGDWARFAIEADGVLLGHARLQLLRPASLRLSQAIQLHFGPQTALPVEPPLVAIDPKAGRSLDITARNNFPQIQNYVLQAEASGLKFLPEKADVSIGASMERVVSMRVFGEGATRGLYSGRLFLSGAANVELPVRFAVIPRGEALAYSADLDGDGAPEWILENAKLRAVFSGQDGGRWLEFVWKDSGLNVLPETGAMAGAGAVEVRLRNDDKQAALEMTAKNWSRTVWLEGNGTKLIMHQVSPLPPETLRGGKVNEVLFQVSREAPNRAVYSIERLN